MAPKAKSVGSHFFDKRGYRWTKHKDGWRRDPRPRTPHKDGDIWRSKSGRIYTMVNGWKRKVDPLRSVHREEGEVWVYPSGHVYTKRGGRLVYVGYDVKTAKRNARRRKASPPR